MNTRTKKIAFHGMLTVLAVLEYIAARNEFRKHACAAWAGFHISCTMVHVIGDPE